MFIILLANRKAKFKIPANLKLYINKILKDQQKINEKTCSRMLGELPRRCQASGIFIKSLAIIAGYMGGCWLLTCYFRGGLRVCPQIFDRLAVRRPIQIYAEALTREPGDSKTFIYNQLTC
jgi:uncharacterized protein YneF (UPF0154 family)